MADRTTGIDRNIEMTSLSVSTHVEEMDLAENDSHGMKWIDSRANADG